MLEENVTWKKGMRGRGRGREGLRVFGRVLSLPDLIGGSLGRVVMRLIRALMKSMVRFGVGYRMIRSERTMINAVSHRQSVIRLFWRVLPFHWEKGDFFFSLPLFTNIYDAMNTFGMMGYRVVTILWIGSDRWVSDERYFDAIFLRLLLLLLLHSPIAEILNEMLIFSDERLWEIMGRLFRMGFRANRFGEDWWTNRGPFWFTRINKRLRVVDGGLLGTKGRRINGETGGRCPGTDRVARSVSRHRCEDEWNDQIEFQPDTRRALSRFQRFTCSRSRTRSLRTCVYVYVSPLARVSPPLLNRVSIRSSKFSHDLYILIAIIHRTATLKKYTGRERR